MADDVLVILGAGASHDVVNESEPHPAQILDADLKPPLTNQLFGDNGVCASALAPYPGVTDLAATIRNRLGERGSTLEGILRDLSEASQEHRKAQVYQVPLYLADVFWQVSRGYASVAVNYTTLVDELMEAFDRAVFLTLNYDLLLDDVLASRPYWGGPMKNMTSYLRDRWILVKLHGSVNWGWRLDVTQGGIAPPYSGNPDRNTLVEALNWPQRGKLNKKPAVLEGFDQFWQKSPHYPALAMPIEGKYDYVCPRPHIDALEQRLPACESVVAIGASGKDRDLIDVLSAHLGKVSRFMVVGKGGDTADAMANFGAVPQLSAAGIQMHDGGFSSFLRSGGLDSLRPGR